LYSEGVVNLSSTGFDQNFLDNLRSTSR